MTGALPLAVLEQKIDDWIAPTRRLTPACEEEPTMIRQRLCWPPSCFRPARRPLARAQAARCSPPLPRRRRTSQRLQRLFRESDEASLRRNPLQAMFRGDYRYADRLGDFGSATLIIAAEKAAAEQDLAALAAIDRGALNADRAHRLRRLQIAAAARSSRPAAGSCSR